MKKDFNLSIKTSLFITSKAEKGDFPYAALCRQKVEDGPRRLFYMTLNNVLELLSMLLQIGALIKKESQYEQSIPLDNYKEVSVTNFRGQKYLCFKNNGKKPNMMNINKEEFMELAKMKDDITQYVKDVKDLIKRQKQNKTSNTAMELQENESVQKVTIYRWSYLCPSTGDVITEGTRGYEELAQCKQAGEQSKPSLDIAPNFGDPLLMTYSVQIPLPRKAEVFRMIHIYVYKKFIERIRDGECYACNHNLPYTNSLHEDGCCMDWEDAIKLYYLKVYSSPEIQGEAHNLFEKIMAKPGTKHPNNLQAMQKPSFEEVAEWNLTIPNELYEVFQAFFCQAEQ